MKDTQELARVWAEVEDRLAPALRLDLFERVVYDHLLRRRLFTGRRTFTLKAKAIEKLTGVTGFSALRRLHQFFGKGCVRVICHGHHGTTVETLLPEEIWPRLDEFKPPQTPWARPPSQDIYVRRAIWRREFGRCFYCLREIEPQVLTVDHVVPTSAGGVDALENLVACCFECNITKGRLRAIEFLRLLYRRNLINVYEFNSRIKFLKDLRKGRFRLKIGRPPGKKPNVRPIPGGDRGLATSGRQL